MNYTISGDTYQRLCCTECACVYFFPATWTQNATENGKQWKCPNGHGQWFGQGELDKIRRERDLLKQRLAQRDDEITGQRNNVAKIERRLNATKGVITRIKNRVGHGVCPCCNRTFSDLQRHMHSKHPAFSKEQIEAAE